MKKKEDEPKKGAPSYMSTYGDMMTLLLCFFVLLFSMSTVDAVKLEQLVSSFTTTVSIFEGGQTILPDTNALQNGMSQFPIEESIFSVQDAADIERALQEAKADLTQYVKANNLDDKVTIEKKGDEIIVRFADVLLFDSGKASIKAGAIPALNLVGEKLNSYVEKGYFLKVEGHTDNVAIHTTQFPSNWELSGARAIAVMRFYLEEMDFDLSKISYVGLGEYQPIASNATPEGRAKNRRVEIKLTLPVTK